MNATLVATWYVALVGAPLFCGGTYDLGEVWIALPFEEHGEWQCGDLIYISFLNGDALLARVRDAGPFGKHCILQVDGSCVDIGADVPKHAWPVEGALSAPVVVYNITAEARRVGVQ